MFDLKEKIIMCDMSNFTLGINIAIFKDGVVTLKTVAYNKEQAMELVYKLCETQNITTVFIRPLMPYSTDKLLSEFKQCAKEKFSKSVDNIQFHMI